MQVCTPDTHKDEDREESSVFMEGEVIVQMCFMEAAIGEMYTQ